jgi:hypothetical protein
MGEAFRITDELQRVRASCRDHWQHSRHEGEPARDPSRAPRRRLGESSTAPLPKSEDQDPAATDSDRVMAWEEAVLEAAPVGVGPVWDHPALAVGLGEGAAFPLSAGVPGAGLRNQVRSGRAIRRERRRRSDA